MKTHMFVTLQLECDLSPLGQLQYQIGKNMDMEGEREREREREREGERERERDVNV